MKLHSEWKWHPKLLINDSVYKHLREGGGKVHFWVKISKMEQLLSYSWKYSHFHKSCLLRSPARWLRKNVPVAAGSVRVWMGREWKMIFLLRGALAQREKYFSKNIFGALNIFILKIQEIRSWLKTLFNQCYFGCFWSPDLHKSDFFIKSALFAKICIFTENMTFLLKISILH